MDDRGSFIGVVYLGTVALLASVIMGILSLQGREIPNAVAGAFCTAVGALAMRVTPARKD